MLPGAEIEPARPEVERFSVSCVYQFHHPGKRLILSLLLNHKDLNWRLVPESNRRLRLCRPLHNHFANAPLNYTKKGNEFPFLTKIWSGKRGSNSRPIPWQGIALPAELFPQTEGSILAIFSILSMIVKFVARYSLHFFYSIY